MPLAIARVLSWLNTYEGNDYELYQRVYDECRQSYVCSEMMKFFNIEPKVEVRNYHSKAENKCNELIERAKQCISRNENECTYITLINLLNSGCHNGYAFNRDVVDYVKEIVHYIWRNLSKDDRCAFLSYLRDVGLSKWWVRDALGYSSRNFDKLINGCGIDWDRRIPQNRTAEYYEQVLRYRFGVDEVRECDGMFRYYGVDVRYLRDLGIEPCAYLHSKKPTWPYWAGLYATDLYVEPRDDMYQVSFDTSNGSGLLMALNTLNELGMPSIVIRWHRKGAPHAKYVSGDEVRIKTIIYTNNWPWESKDSMIKQVAGFNRDELIEFLAGAIDGDGYITITSSARPIIYITSGANKYTWLRELRREIINKLGISCTIKPMHNVRTNELTYLLEIRNDAVLRAVEPYLHHPVRKLRARLIIEHLSGRLSHEQFSRAYEQTKYKINQQDNKHNSALYVAIHASSLGQAVNMG